MHITTTPSCRQPMWPGCAKSGAASRASAWQKLRGEDVQQRDQHLVHQPLHVLALDSAAHAGTGGALAVDAEGRDGLRDAEFVATDISIYPCCVAAKKAKEGTSAHRRHRPHASHPARHHRTSTKNCSTNRNVRNTRPLWSAWRCPACCRARGNHCRCSTPSPTPKAGPCRRSAQPGHGKNTLFWVMPSARSNRMHAARRGSSPSSSSSSHPDPGLNPTKPARRCCQRSSSINTRRSV